MMGHSDDQNCRESLFIKIPDGGDPAVNQTAAQSELDVISPEQRAELKSV